LLYLENSPQILWLSPFHLHKNKENMKLANMATMAMTTLGAALEIRDPMANTNLTTSIGSVTTDARHKSGCSNCRRKNESSVFDAKHDKLMEESLRMVMYLSCWGPN
jgi:Wound-induced protein